MRDTSRTLGKSLQDDKISNIYLPAKNTLYIAVSLKELFFPPFRSQQRIISQNPLFRSPFGSAYIWWPILQCAWKRPVKNRTMKPCVKAFRLKRWTLQVESAEETQQQPITTTTNNDNNNKFSLNSPTYWHPGGTPFFQLHEPQSIPQKKNAFSEGVRNPPGWTPKICSNLKPRS